MGFPAANAISTASTVAVKKQLIEDFLAASKTQPGGLAESELTINGGQVVAVGALHSIDTEGDNTTDDLDNVDVTALQDGSWIGVRAQNDAHVVTLKHEAGGDGEMSLHDGYDAVLDHVDAYVICRVDKSGGTDILKELFRSGCPDTVVAKTANHNVLVREHGVTFTNAGAGGAVAFNLPAARAGLRYRFVCAAAQNVQVVPAAGDEVMFEGTADADGYEETGVGSYLEVLAIDATTWLAIASHGTWTGIP